MKVVKWILAVVAVLVVVFLGGAFFMPSSYRVERTATINAPAAKIYPLIAAPRAWVGWTVWNQREPNMKIAFSGAESGKGARWDWEGKDGKGNMEFTDAQPDKSITYRLGFPDVGMVTTGALTLTPQGDATKISWTNQGDVGGSLVGRWYMPFMDRMMGPDFEAGLANLKAQAEKK